MGQKNIKAAKRKVTVSGLQRWITAYFSIKHRRGVSVMQATGINTTYCSELVIFLNEDKCWQEQREKALVACTSRPKVVLLLFF